MAFLIFGNSNTNGIENKPAFYSFMERGDVVYYRPPGSGKSTMATIKEIQRDELGRPDYVIIETTDGEYIETKVKHISY